MYLLRYVQIYAIIIFIALFFFFLQVIYFDWLINLYKLNIFIYFNNGELGVNQYGGQSHI